jgi:hypothetical protein
VKLKVVGAGLGRTGTHSLKIALEQLLGGPCYHMIEVFGHPEHVPMWAAAMRDEPVDWNAMFEGYKAIVDYPGAAVWDALHHAFPDAFVLLSTRSSADEWYRSASRTIFPAMDTTPPGAEEWHDMAQLMVDRLTPDWRDEDVTKAAYERHNARVRAEVPASQLIEWQPEGGWAPLCAALGVDVPAEPFPVTNTTAEFRAMAHLDD